MPEMPPVVDGFVKSAPVEFKAAAALACLSPLGVLCCQLEAPYIDGDMQTPLFQSNVCAPQASGKGKFGKLVERILSPIERSEEAQQEAQDAYWATWQSIKSVNKQARFEDFVAQYGSEPIPIFRDLGSKVSATAMLELTRNAHGLAIMMSNDEADSLVKSFSSRNTDISDMLRIGWDGGKYTQYMASLSRTFKGMVRLRIASALCGTPDAYERLFPNQVNGFLGRQLFIDLPDRVFERMPMWTPFTAEEDAALDARLQQLHDLGLVRVDDWHWEVQPRHTMDLGYVNSRLKDWLEEQRLRAIEEENRSRATFYRRAGVMGFRAAILAHYLWGEPADEAAREKVVRFALWVAEMALLGSMKHCSLPDDDGTDFLARRVYDELDETFTSVDLESLLKDFNFRTNPSKVVEVWKRGRRVKDTGRRAPTDVGPRKLYRKTKCHKTVAADGEGEEQYGKD